MQHDASFGQHLRRLRKARDLTQQALAQQVFCAVDTIKKFEQGRRRPSRQLAVQLADTLGLVADERTVFLAAARTEREDTPAVAPEGTVTFLFTDMEGSTRLWEQHPETMPALLARHHAMLRQTIARHGGHLFKTVGDGVCAAFASAHAALAAAVEAQHAFHTEAWDALAPDTNALSCTHGKSSIAVRVRMALHTGLVEQQGGDYFGLPLNRAARLLAVGHGGQILLHMRPWNWYATRCRRM